MGSFFKLVFELVGQMVYNVVDWVVAIAMGFVRVFFTGWVDYFAILGSYLKDFNIALKILAILLMLVLIAIPVAIIYFIVKKLILRRRLKNDDVDNSTLYKEIGRLNRQVLDLIDEKNKILALKVNTMGANEPLPYMGSSALMDDEGILMEGVGGGHMSEKDSEVNHTHFGDGSSEGAEGAVAGGPSSGGSTGVPSANLGDDGGFLNIADGEEGVDGVVAATTSNTDKIEATIVKEDQPPFDPTIMRFPKLSLVDKKYEDYERPLFDETITLDDFAEKYRLFAASQLGLYYTPEIIRRFIAGMASSKLLILEGISGTGKTSLPYSFSRFLDNPATIVSVQPSFRDRTEVVGYFNEFSKRFNETEFLRALYEANYRFDPNFIVLDEMNLARIEYYFAEMLSILEMPSHDEWILDLVPTEWPRDPQKLFEGKIQITDNMWFVGTANNDDSTFTITDKVYDRAIPIEINERADKFECEPQGPCLVSNDHLRILFERAKHDHPVSQECWDKLNQLDQYLQTRFKLAFGNRITKQMTDFIPVYVACGGTETGGIDYIVARKVLKKFESMNVVFVRDEIKGLILYIEKIFGKREMPDSVSYLTRIQNLY